VRRDHPRDLNCIAVLAYFKPEVRWILVRTLQRWAFTRLAGGDMVCQESASIVLFLSVTAIQCPLLASNSGAFAFSRPLSATCAGPVPLDLYDLASDDRQRLRQKHLRHQNAVGQPERLGVGQPGAAHHRLADDARNPGDFQLALDQHCQVSRGRLDECREPIRAALLRTGRIRARASSVLPIRASLQWSTSQWPGRPAG